MIDLKKIIPFAVIYCITFFVITHFFSDKKVNDSFTRGDVFTIEEKQNSMKEINKNIDLNTNFSINKEDCKIIETNNGVFKFNEEYGIPLSYEYYHPLTKEKILLFDYSNENKEINNFPSLICMNKDNIFYKFILKSFTEDENNYLLNFVSENENYLFEKNYSINKKTFLIKISFDFKFKNNDEKNSESIKFILNKNLFSFSKDYLNEFFIINSNKKITKIKDNLGNLISITPSIFGVESDLFLNAILPYDNVFQRIFFNDENKQNPILFLETKEIKNNFTGKFSLYIGPKEAPFIKQSCNYLFQSFKPGFMEKISNFFIYIMTIIYNLIGNFGFSIIIFSILIELIFLFAAYFSKDSNKKRDEFGKKYKYIDEKYKDNYEKKMFERQELIKQYGISAAFGGFSFIIIIAQAIVMLSLQLGLRKSIFIQTVPFILWINNLGVGDQYRILPLIFVVLIYLQVSNKMFNPVHRVVLLFGCVLFFFICSYFPVAILLFLISNFIIRYYRTKILGF